MNNIKQVIDNYKKISYELINTYGKSEEYAKYSLDFIDKMSYVDLFNLVTELYARVSCINNVLSLGYLQENKKINTLYRLSTRELLVMSTMIDRERIKWNDSQNNDKTSKVEVDLYSYIDMDVCNYIDNVIKTNMIDEEDKEEFFTIEELEEAYATIDVKTLSKDLERNILISN